VLLNLVTFFVASLVSSYSVAETSASAQCLASMCPPTADRPRSEAHLQQIKMDFKTLIVPLIAKRFQYVAVRETLNRKIVETYLARPESTVELSDDVRAQINLLLVADSFGTFEDALKKRSDGDFDVDERKVREIFEREKMFTDDQEGFLQALKALAQSGLGNLMTLSQDYKLSTVGRAIGFKGTKEELIKYFGEYIRSLDEKEKNLSPYVISGKSSILKKIDSGVPITDDDSAFLIYAYASARMRFTLWSHTHLRRYMLALHVNHLQLAKSKARETLAAGFRSNPPAQHASHKVCLENFMSTLKSFPTQEEISRFDSQSRMRLLAVAISVAHSKNWPEAEEQLRKAKFLYPAPYEVAVKNLVADSLIDNREHDRLATEKLQAMLVGVESNDQPALAAMTAYILASSDTLNAFYKNIQSDCESVSPTGLVDDTSFDPENGSSILVSWQNILHVVSPVSLAHESGHIVYRAYPRRPESLQRQLICLNKKHAGIDADPSGFEEEDYADLFAGQVSKLLESSNLEHPFCEYVQSIVRNNLSQYMSLQQPANDEHSSFLFRLISMANEEGKLTPVCRSFIKESQADALTVSCW
jgi:hypothetical protein